MSRIIALALIALFGVALCTAAYGDDAPAEEAPAPAKTDEETPPAKPSEKTPADPATSGDKEGGTPAKAVGELHRVLLGTDGFADVMYGSGTRVQVGESSEASFFMPEKGVIEGRSMTLHKGAATITLAKNPFHLHLPVGETVLTGPGACATFQIVVDENDKTQTIQVTNQAPADPAKKGAALKVFVAGKQLEITVGKSFKLSAGALDSIAGGGKVVLPAVERPETLTDTFWYHTGEKGSLSIKFPGKQRLLGSQNADVKFGMDRTGGFTSATGRFQSGFFRGRLSKRSFALLTPANRIRLGEDSGFWMRIDPSGEWDRIQHEGGSAMTLESAKVEGFRLGVPVKGGADLIHPKDTDVVLLSVHKGLPPSRPIVIKYGGRVFELPAEGRVKPGPAASVHPEDKGEVLMESGEVSIMIYRDGRPLSYRFRVDENDLAIPRGDAFKDSGDVKNVAESSPFLR